MEFIAHHASVFWDWLKSINWTTASIAFSTLAGPVLAVQAQKWIERSRGTTERRRAIYLTLMATRATPMSPAHVEALNGVPVEFYGSKGRLKIINDKWKLYLKHHEPPIEPDEAWFEKKGNLLIDLLYQMTLFLGYNLTRDQLAKDIYYPGAYSELESEQTIIRRGVAALLTGQAALPLAVKEFPVDEKVMLDQAALLRLLKEWLEGQCTVKVRNENDI